MRNLKRVLSLTLASVMLLGMMVVGAGAADYSDVDYEKDNVEAIEVLNAVGVMLGDADSSGNLTGTFRPGDEVSRAEMAVIMAKLMNLDYTYYISVNPFNDMVGHWAEGYAAACYANGIIAGRTSTSYDPSATVTTVEAAAMLMRALGYFQNKDVDYADGFEIATIRQGGRIDLFNGVDSKTNDPMTRNDVAQLVLNTLKSGMVEPDNGNRVSVTVGDAQVTVGATNYVYVTSRENYAYAIYASKAEDGASGTAGLNSAPIVELGEKLYQGDLQLDSYYDNRLNNPNTDAFERPADTWIYKNEKIGTYTYVPDYSFYAQVTPKALYEAVGATAVEKYHWVIYNNGDYVWDAPNFRDLTEYRTVDSGDFFKKVVGTVPSSLFVGNPNPADRNKDLTGNGVLTEVYVDGTDGIVRVAVTDFYAAEVYQVKNDKITLYDLDFGPAATSSEFDAVGFEEDDIVYYTYAKESIQSVELADRIEGEVTKAVANTVDKNGKNFDLDGENNYKYLFTMDTSKALTTENVANDMVGYTMTLGGKAYCLYIDMAAVTYDYAYVLSAGYSRDNANNNGAKMITNPSADETVWVRLVFPDGSMKTVETDYEAPAEIKAPNTTPGKDGLNDTNDGLENLRYHIVSYSVNSAGVYSLAIRDTDDPDGDGEREYDYVDGTAGRQDFGKVEDIFSNGKSKVYDAKGGVWTANDNTVVIVGESGSNLNNYSFTVYTGVQNIPDIKSRDASDDAHTTWIAVAASNKRIAKVVYVQNADVYSKNAIFVVANSGADVTLEKDGTSYYNLVAYENGEKISDFNVKKNSTAYDKLITGASKQSDVTLGQRTSSNKTKFVVALQAVSRDNDGYVTNVKVYPTDSKNTNYMVTGSQTGKNDRGAIVLEGSGKGSSGNDSWYALSDARLVTYDVKKDVYTVSATKNVKDSKIDEYVGIISDGDLVGLFIVDYEEPNGATNTPSDNNKKPVNGPDPEDDSKFIITYTTDKAPTKSEIIDAVEKYLKETYGEDLDGFEVNYNVATGKITIKWDDGTTSIYDAKLVKVTSSGTTPGGPGTKPEEPEKEPVKVTFPGRGAVNIIRDDEVITVKNGNVSELAAGVKIMPGDEICLDPDEVFTITGANIKSKVVDGVTVYTINSDFTIVADTENYSWAGALSTWTRKSNGAPVWNEKDWIDKVSVAAEPVVNYIMARAAVAAADNGDDVGLNPETEKIAPAKGSNWFKYYCLARIELSIRYPMGNGEYYELTVTYNADGGIVIHDNMDEFDSEEYADALAALDEAEGNIENMTVVVDKDAPLPGDEPGGPGDGPTEPEVTTASLTSLAVNEEEIEDLPAGGTEEKPEEITVTIGQYDVAFEMTAAFEGEAWYSLDGFTQAKFSGTELDSEEAITFGNIGNSTDIYIYVVDEDGNEGYYLLTVNKAVEGPYLVTDPKYIAVTGGTTSTTISLKLEGLTGTQEIKRIQVPVKGNITGKAVGAGAINPDTESAEYNPTTGVITYKTGTWSKAAEAGDIVTITVKGAVYGESTDINIDLPVRAATIPVYDVVVDFSTKGDSPRDAWVISDIVWDGAAPARATDEAAAKAFAAEVGALVEKKLTGTNAGLKYSDCVLSGAAGSYDYRLDFTNGTKIVYATITNATAARWARTVLTSASGYNTSAPDGTWYAVSGNVDLAITAAPDNDMVIELVNGATLTLGTATDYTTGSKLKKIVSDGTGKVLVSAATTHTPEIQNVASVEVTSTTAAAVGKITGADTVKVGTGAKVTFEAAVKATTIDTTKAAIVTFSGNVTATTVTLGGSENTYATLSGSTTTLKAETLNIVDKTILNDGNTINVTTLNISGGDLVVGSTTAGATVIAEDINVAAGRKLDIKQAGTVTAYNIVLAGKSGSTAKLSLESTGAGKVDVMTKLDLDTYGEVIYATGSATAGATIKVDGNLTVGKNSTITFTDGDGSTKRTGNTSTLEVTGKLTVKGTIDNTRDAKIKVGSLELNGESTKHATVRYLPSVPEDQKVEIVGYADIQDGAASSKTIVNVPSGATLTLGDDTDHAGGPDGVIDGDGNIGGNPSDTDAAGIWDYDEIPLLRGTGNVIVKAPLGKKETAWANGKLDLFRDTVNPTVKSVTGSGDTISVTIDMTALKDTQLQFTGSGTFENFSGQYIDTFRTLLNAAKGISFVEFDTSALDMTGKKVSVKYYRNNQPYDLDYENSGWGQSRPLPGTILNKVWNQTWHDQWGDRTEWPFVSLTYDEAGAFILPYSAEITRIVITISPKPVEAGPDL